MSIVEIATRRRVTVAMFTVTFVLFGVIALFGLKVNLLPDLSYPTLTVRTEYEGAAPLEIENLITQPVEEVLGVVKNVRKLHSVSRTGQSDIILEFTWGTDMDMASLEVRDKLELLQLPLEAKKPLLLRFNPSTDPIIRYGLSGKSDDKGFNEAELKQLRRFADDELKKRLEPISGVAAVKVGGGLEDEVAVEIDQQKLSQLGIGVQDVVQRLKDENVNISGGRIEEGSQRYLVRTINQFATVEEMRELLVRVDNGVPIRLKDVARVHQSYKEREGIVRIDGREAIELAVYKEGDANTVSVADGIKSAVERMRTNKTLPANAELKVIDDQSLFIGAALHEVRFDALLGGVLAILVIFFFLHDSWSTFIIALSLPVSLITTFFFMGQADLSLNVMSLGGLALATGMVVDDSIVVLENIARLREKNLSIVEAAVQGTKEVGMAVTASTLTTVAVFFPLVFVQGVAGQLFRDQALTITFAMLISLVVSMTLIPMLASLKGNSPLAYREEFEDAKPQGRLGAIPRGIVWLFVGLFRTVGGLVGGALRVVGKVVLAPYNRLAASYTRMLPNVLQRPWLVLGFALASFLATLMLVPTLGMDLIPQLAQGRFEMTVKLPPGTPLATSDTLARELQLKHANDPNIASIYGVAGVGTRLDANPTESGENIARLLVTLKPTAGEAGERAAMDALRQTMATHPGGEVKFSRPQLFSFSTPLEIEIRGYDLDTLKKAGQKLTGLMKASDRFTDVKSTVEGGYPEVQIRFDQDRAAALGLTTRTIADQVVRKVRGEVATRYNFRDRKIDVLVRAREDDRASVDDIRNIIVNSDAVAAAAAAAAAAPGQVSAVKPIRLSAVADVVATEGPSEIHRVSQERVAIVSSNLAYGDLGTAVEEVRSILAKNPLAAGISVNIGGQSEELDSSVNSLIFALALAIFLVYLVMASQFESLLHPFVIMFSIPLAAVGAVLALKLTGNAVSVVVFIGLIMLVGIVVKNAIVLIDRVNQLREAGMDKRAAIVQGAESRLRPIVMTTLCTLIGFLPLAIGLGDGAEVRAPMAITVIGGLLVSTLLTLVVIPIVYDRLDFRGDAWYRARAERQAARRASATLEPAS
ncbi:MAG: acriflavin resistance protein [Lysobacterales bacterium 69-70]|nr:efflux RND transporter permease subunit [Xanthomonadaceae bacterium]ODU33601.1 MAG: acriflavin resistance protein [Xanthomonadaceae bacterium SCN 69-320]ODV21954.1 MAG: acriflavin resistance protein [Xanthomonadaceae bacterium SCN 69-25]OJZ02857.1 MAG: acriflavin resistance protein [Xanthomonadales bacterium 69-70]